LALALLYRHWVQSPQLALVNLFVLLGLMAHWDQTLLLLLLAQLGQEAQIHHWVLLDLMVQVLLEALKALCYQWHQVVQCCLLAP
jgi:hypothetical protein